MDIKCFIIILPTAFLKEAFLLNVLSYMIYLKLKVY